MKKFVAVFSIIFVLLLAGCVRSTNKTSESTREKAKTERVSPFIKSKTPTLFFHGYSGGKSSFGSMLKRLEMNGLTKQQLILIVQEDGTIDQQGTWDKDSSNPTVQVLFENNKSTQWNQSSWIQSALTFMHDTYQVDKVNLVGHSMGSVSALDYLERHSKESNQPEVKKVVLIAGPFNEFLDTFDSQTQKDVLTNGPSQVSGRYEGYLKLAKDIPKGIAFQVISGKLSEEELTDEAVPLSSSLSIIPLLHNQGFQVESKVITGKDAQHSKLHENKEVDEDIRQFLWGK